MEPASQDAVRKWWQRLKRLFLVAVAVQAAHLSVLGFDPKGFIQRHPWSLWLDRFVFAVVGFLLVAVVTCWFGILLTSRDAPIKERRGLLLITAICLVEVLGQRWRGVFGVYVASTGAQLILGVLLFWWWVKALEEKTQREIDAKLNRSVSAPVNPGQRRCDA
jgi:hypothetical protein